MRTLQRLTFLFLQSLQKQFYGFKEKKFVSSLGNLYYLDNKNDKKPAVILIHGFSDIPENLIRSTHYLKKDYRVILPALKGFDKEGVKEDEQYSLEGYADQIVELTEKLGIKSFIVGGNSLGGATALKIYAKYPKKVQELIIMDSAGFEFNGIETITTKVKEGQPNPFLIENENQFDSFMKQLFYQTPKELNALKKIFLEKYTSKRRAYEYLAEQLFLENQDEKFIIAPNEIKVPSLIVWGEHDQFFPVSLAKRLYEEIPESKLAIIEHSGHLPHIERPFALAKILKDFLDQRS